MTGHPDPDALAEFREGLLGRRRARRIRAHLAGCPRCAAVHSQIAEVSSLLASSPAPRMPDQLARRLEAALAAESAARAAQALGPEAAQAAQPAGTRTPDGSPAPEPALADHDGRGHRDQPAGRPGETDRPGLAGWAGKAGRVSPRDQAGQESQTDRILRPGRVDQESGTGHASRPGRAARRRRPVAPRVPALRAAAIAAAVVVIAGGSYGLARVLSGPAGQAASAGSAAGPSADRPAILQPVVSPGAKSGALGAPGAVLPLIHSGTDYQPGQLVTQVELVMRRQPAHAAPGSFGALPQNRGLAACVSVITRGIRLRLVDQARYRGRPATIIVTAGAGGLPGQVWVAGSDCSASHPDVIAHAQLSGTG